MITVDADCKPLSEEAFVARKAKISKVVTTYFSMGCPKDNKLGAIIRTLRSDAMRRMHSERTATQVGASNAKRERTVSRLPIAVQIRMAGALLNISTKKRRQDERDSRERLPTKSLEEVLKLTNETIKTLGDVAGVPIWFLSIIGADDAGQQAQVVVGSSVPQ